MKGWTQVGLFQRKCGSKTMKYLPALTGGSEMGCLFNPQEDVSKEDALS